jgi:hypothetical protein
MISISRPRRDALDVGIAEFADIAGLREVAPARGERVRAGSIAPCRAVATICTRITRWDFGRQDHGQLATLRAESVGGRGVKLQLLTLSVSSH